MSKLDSALAHARAGWPVFPCHNNDCGRCSCGGPAVNPKCSPGKHPIVPHGLKQAACDEAQIRKWWTRWPDANIAGRCDGKAVVDVDIRDGKQGMATLVALEAEHGGLERALVQRSGSGGLHLVFAMRDGARYPGKLGSGVDVKAGAGAYILLAGSDHESGGTYAWEVGDGASTAYTRDLPTAPKWLERKTGPATRTGDAPGYYFPTVDALAAAVAYIPNNSEWDARSDWLNMLSAVEYESNGSERGREIALEWSEQHPSHDGDKFEACWRSLNWRKHLNPLTGQFIADHARTHGWVGDFDDLDEEPAGDRSDDKTKCESVVDELNKRFAAVRLNGTTIVAEFTRDKIDFGTPAALHLWFENDRALVGKSLVPKSKIWLKSPARKSFPEGVVFAPGRTAPEGALNLWRGWGVKPNPNASCGLILKHILEVISAGDARLFDYNVKYDAHMVQRPWEKPGVARVLRGKRGAGKDTYGELLRRICGRQHSAVIGDSDRLTARFNSIFESALFGHVEEAFWSGDHRARGRLQHFITSVDIVIERKGLESFAVQSFVRLLMTTNEDWAVPAGPDERRYFVADVSDRYMQKSAYFAPLRTEIEGDGAGAYLHYLLNLDLTGFDIRAVPQTQALRDQKIETLGPIERWWHDRMDAEHWWSEDGSGLAVSKDAVYGDYERYARALKYGGNPRAREAVFKRLMEMCPALAEKRGRRSGGDRKRIFQMPPLPTCERAFERFAGVARSSEELIG